MARHPFAWAFTAVALVAPALFAALPPQRQEQLKENATHIITGEVGAVERNTRLRSPTMADYVYTIQITLAGVEKGEGIAAKQMVKVQTWEPSLRPRGWVGPQGQNDIPRTGQQVRAYLSRTAEGAFDLLTPNGWELMKPQPATRASTQPTTQPDATPQGVRGRVLKLTGNFMPGPGPRGGNMQPLAVPVHIFKGALKPFAGPAKESPAFLATTQADAQGQYTVALPPGEYTVIAEIDGKLYLNIQQGDGSWATVHVKPDQWLTWDIRDTSGAAF